MSRPLRLQQPGPEQAPRIVDVEAYGRSIRLFLEPGLPLLEAVQRAFTVEGFSSGVVELGALALSPFAYVMPALSPDGANVAFYSSVHRPQGVTRFEAGAMTFGSRNGAPFFHCHALWREADGKRSGGHVLPEDGTIIAEAITVTALGFRGAMFETTPDLETNFTLFSPRKTTTETKTGSRVLVLRVKPNQDLIGALETVAAAHRIRHGKVRGGVGSLIGAEFADGTVVKNFATEVFVYHGIIFPGENGKPNVILDIASVDYTGNLESGRLVKGRNPVLVTFEITIEDIAN